MTIMTTITNMSISTLPEFMRLVGHFRNALVPTQPDRFTIMPLNYLREPRWFSPMALPPELKHEIKGKLERFAVVMEHDPMFNFAVTEKETYRRIIDIMMMDEVRWDDVKGDFQAFIAQYDQRRGKQFSSVFPDLLQLLAP